MDLLNALKESSNYKLTENGAIAHNSTMDKLYDMFALGGAYRSRSETDCILLFKEAYYQNPVYALKCLFYLRDIRGCGQGERRFFRVCMKWLANYDPDAARRNIKFIPEYGRFDDLYCLVDTPLEEEMFKLITKQFCADLISLRDNNGAVSLLAKWAPSENTSSNKTKMYARKTIKALGITAREYRKMLSALRERIKVLERLMSQNRWEEIDFGKIPSRAGLIYRNAFARRDLIAQKYESFIKSDTTKVNAGTLYPYDVVAKALDYMNTHIYSNNLNDVNRLAINKYWDNLTDYFNGASLNAMVVCDTSSSMTWGATNATLPIHIAISLAMYAAERARGPFANHYISFSHAAKLVEVRGVDFCAKVHRIMKSNLCEDTNLSSVFDLLLSTINAYNLTQKDVPETIVIVSDMEINSARRNLLDSVDVEMSRIRDRWRDLTNIRFPKVVYWNVNARNDTILDDNSSGITYVSGASPVLFEQIMSGKTGMDLMYAKLDSDRYKDIF